MDTIFSLLKDIEKTENIKVYITGEYLRDFLIGKKSDNMEILVSDRVKDIAKDFSEKIDIDLITVEENNCYKVLDIDRELNIYFYGMKNKSLNEILQNKDFTINSLATTIESFEDLSKENIIDPTGGLQDIENNILRIWDENNLIRNPLIAIKAVNLMSELNFELERDTVNIIKKNKDKISNINGKTMADELFKIFRNRKTYYYLNYMDRELDILDEVFPEIKTMKDVGECKYHVVDSFTHSIYVLKLTENIIYYDGYFEDHIREAYEKHADEKIEGEHTRAELIKLAALFHDVGKPSARKVDKTGRVRFKGHEITGAEIIKDISERFEMSIKARDILYRIVAKHMLPLVSYKSNDASANFLYKMFNECGDETLEVLLIALADIVATRKLLNPDEKMGKFKVHIQYMANNYITRYKEIEDISNIIKGSDILKEYDLPENILVSELIEEVRKAIFTGKIGPTKTSALKYIKSLL